MFLGPHSPWAFCGPSCGQCGGQFSARHIHLGHTPSFLWLSMLGVFSEAPGDCWVSEGAAWVHPHPTVAVKVAHSREASAGFSENQFCCPQRWSWWQTLIGAFPSFLPYPLMLPNCCCRLIYKTTYAKPLSCLKIYFKQGSSYDARLVPLSSYSHDEECSPK